MLLSLPLGQKKNTNHPLFLMYKLGNVFFLRVFKYAQGNPSPRSAQWNVDMELENNSLIFRQRVCTECSLLLSKQDKIGTFFTPVCVFFFKLVFDRGLKSIVLFCSFTIFGRPHLSWSNFSRFKRFLNKLSSTALVCHQKASRSIKKGNKTLEFAVSLGK